MFNLIETVTHGHEVVCLANLNFPNPSIERDSRMFKTKGMEITPLIAQAMELPLVSRQITGTAVKKWLYYEKSKKEATKFDEVEDLFELLTQVKREYPQV